MALTPSQRAAVAYDQNLIIFAGPGSGKTSTSVAKGIQILKGRGAVLGMATFTTAAAQEMQDRIARADAQGGGGLLSGRLICGTFNSITLKHYQRHARTPRKLIAPPARAALLSGMLRDHDPDTREELIRVLDAHQAKLDPRLDGLNAPQQAFISTYLRKLDATGAIDLAGVMRTCTVEMATGAMPLLRVTHLLGDEMQDADEVQLEFMLVHARSGVKTTLVADDDQTIYAWRSAMGYAGLQHFAQSAGAKTIVLAENFRSRSEIVRHATTLIARNDPDRIAKNQRPVRGEGGSACAVSFGGLKHECQAIAQHIALTADSSQGETVAVLARTNVALWSMQAALMEAEVPFRRDGPSMWDEKEVALYLGLLRALVSGQTIDFAPVLAAAPFDQRLVGDITVALGADCTDFLDGKVPSLDHATAQDFEHLAELAEAAAKWRGQLRAGMFDLVIAEASEFTQRWVLRGIADEAQQRRAQRRVPRLLSDVERVLVGLTGKLSRRLQIIVNLQSTEGDPAAVRLLTMHGSKGLEFDTVYLVDATKPDDGKSLADVPSERRLFYVALTRAKERFVATYSKGAPTPFIAEAELPLRAQGEVFVRQATATES